MSKSQESTTMVFDHIKVLAISFLVISFVIEIAFCFCCMLHIHV